MRLTAIRTRAKKGWKAVRKELGPFFSVLLGATAFLTLALGDLDKTPVGQGVTFVLLTATLVVILRVALSPKSNDFWRGTLTIVAIALGVMIGMRLGPLVTPVPASDSCRDCTVIENCPGCTIVRPGTGGTEAEPPREEHRVPEPTSRVEPPLTVAPPPGEQEAAERRRARRRTGGTAGPRESEPQLEIEESRHEDVAVDAPPDPVVDEWDPDTVTSEGPGGAPAEPPVPDIQPASPTPEQEPAPAGAPAGAAPDVQPPAG